ncbi:hypothetical protein FB45DRAFT_1067826 [Roridomyces roridus]|uniref:Uncharacterized protein n=1 Tax=Roridomyces roridus TaxID=1738132 RepID=A0AAD7B2H9_9AGAR|nr:hypothetical protein FB45DRAFT_1067826 [Roridomyces roridus]
MSMEVPNEIAHYLLGPWLIGTCVELVFQGVLLAQFAKYFTVFPGDPPSLKTFVGVLLVLTCLKSADAFAIIWHLMISEFGNPVSFYLGVRYWYHGCNGIFAHTIAVYVQSYYCFRLFVLCRRWYLVAAVSVLLFLSYAVIWVGTMLSVQGNGQEAAAWFVAYPALVLAGDCVLTATTAHYLLKSRRVTPSSAGLLKALTVLVFQTAAPAAICAILTFILALTFPNRYPSARIAVSHGPNIVLAKLYAFSLMTGR